MWREWTRRPTTTRHFIRSQCVAAAVAAAICMRRRRTHPRTRTLTVAERVTHNSHVASFSIACSRSYVLQSDALQYLIGRVKKSRRAPGQDGASAPPPPSAPTTT